MNRNTIFTILVGAAVGLLLGNVIGNAVLGLILGLALGVGAIVMQGRTMGLGGSRRVGGRSAYQELLAKAGGDQSLVDRLIAFEQKRNPSGTKQQWTEDALDRWLRDRA